jgi:hypothetical protein
LNNFNWGAAMRSDRFAIVCLTIVFLAPLHAHAEEYVAAVGQVAVGHCRADECSFFVIEDSKPVGSTSEGVLFAIAAKTWENEYRSRPGANDHERDRQAVKPGAHNPFVTFVFCSRTRPTEFVFRDNKWSADSLRPGDEPATNSAEEYAYVFYWAACHDVISRDPFSAQLADRLGYHFKGHPTDDASSKARPDLQPMDVLR